MIGQARTSRLFKKNVPQARAVKETKRTDQDGDARPAEPRAQRQRVHPRTTKSVRVLPRKHGQGPAMTTHGHTYCPGVEPHCAAGHCSLLSSASAVTAPPGRYVRDSSG